MADQKSDQNPAIDVVSLLTRCGQGKLLADLYAAIAGVSQEVLETGNPGGVVLNLKIAQWEDEPMVTMDGSVKPQLPAGKNRRTAFYPLEGALYRDDPRQIPMELRTVDEEERPMRLVDEAARIAREVD